MATRPAQGNNSYRPLHTARPAYVKDPAPRIVSTGTLSHPKSATAGGFRGTRLVADATPKVVQL